MKDRDCPRSGERQGQNVENVDCTRGPERRSGGGAADKLNGATAPCATAGARAGSNADEEQSNSDQLLMALLNGSALVATTVQRPKNARLLLAAAAVLDP